MVEFEYGTPRVFVSPYGFWGCWQASSITPKLYLGKDGYWYREFKDFFETKEEIEKILNEDGYRPYFCKE
jgi:hypothetical protein